MGTPFKIGERTFDVPRLRVGPYERAMLAIDGAQAPQADDPFGLRRVTAICGAIVELLKENHPDLTVDEVKELVCLADLDMTITGVMAAAGRKRDQGEGVSP